MPCHKITDLQDNGTFNHKGKEHRKFICLQCDARWQWSPETGYYQIRTKNAMPRRVHSFRATDQEVEAIVEEFGSVQGGWDSLVRE